MTEQNLLHRILSSNFNSHPHEEDDLGNSSSVTASPISTHILTKRMTVLHCVIGDIKNHFNSHPHEEDDQLPRLGIVSSKHFNSHPHEEDDVLYAVILYTIIYFNSHPHEEDDANRQGREGQHAYFNSHPHEEDDSIGRLFGFYTNISTHILTKRMTPVSAFLRMA